MSGQGRGRYGLKKLLGSITASVDEESRLRHVYLVAENRLLRQQITGRVPLTDTDRQALAEMGQQLDKKALTRQHRVEEPAATEAQGARSCAPRSLWTCSRTKMDLLAHDLHSTRGHAM